MDFAAYAADTEFEEHTLTEVTRSDDGREPVDLDNLHYAVRMGSMGLGLPAKELGDWVPMAGDVIRIFGSFGRLVRGVAVRREDVFRPVYYMTPAEQRAKHEAANRKAQVEKLVELEETRTERDARVTALPEVFRARIAHFTKHGGGDTWRANFESYEVMVCEQAVGLAEALRPLLPPLPEPVADAAGPNDDPRWVAVDKFVSEHVGDNETAVRKIFPQLDGGHSGNSYGAMVMLTKLYLYHEPLVFQMHGALATLVGCDEYGCTHPRSLPVASQ